MRADPEPERSSPHHLPVLADAVRTIAAARPGEVWVDCTLGFGGHTRALLEAGATVYGVDQDADARACAAQTLAEFSDRFFILAGNFRAVGALLEAEGVTAVDGLLADIGVSSFQLDQAHRGFAFRHAGPVDMRMNPDAGRSALALIQESSVGELAGMIRGLGEEPFAGPIARAIKAWADAEGPHDTVGLAETVRGALPTKVARTRGRHPATRTFQALRIAVNDELGALDDLLAAIPGLMAPDGRALIITFHSLEDRRVKKAFAKLTRPAPSPRRGLPPPTDAPPPFIALTRKPVIADASETESNPRARSAKLRAIQRRPAVGGRAA